MLQAILGNICRASGLHFDPPRQENWALLNGQILALKMLDSNEWCPELNPELSDLQGKNILKKKKREHLNTQSLFHSVHE